MAERQSSDGNAAAANRPPPLPPIAAMAPPVFCLKCAADVSRLPPTAGYCNRCGSPLPTRPSPARPAAPQNFEAPVPTPAILVAYARALFNLGCRYESAVGARRNLDEAARCYWKAARLGDAASAGRFAPQALAVPVLPYPPPPLPPPAA